MAPRLYGTKGRRHDSRILTRTRHLFCPNRWGCGRIGIYFVIQSTENSWGKDGRNWVRDPGRSARIIARKEKEIKRNLRLISRRYRPATETVAHCRHDASYLSAPVPSLWGNSAPSRLSASDSTHHTGMRSFPLRSKPNCCFPQLLHNNPGPLYSTQPVSGSQFLRRSLSLG